MKRFVLQLVFVVGAVFGAAAAQACTNRLGSRRCSDLLARVGCGKLQVRLDCRRTCNVCDSYEIPDPEKLTMSAALYGGNHILTFDKLPYDCNGRGEFTLLRNVRTGTKVNALFKKPPKIRTSVTKAIVVRGGTGLPKLQIAISDTLSAGASREEQCRLLFRVGSMRLTKAQVAQLGGYGGIALIDRFEPFFYKMDSPSGLRVTLSLRYGAIQGCYFDRIIVKMKQRLVQNMKGLLGTPDNNLFNDWHNVAGTIFPIGTQFSRTFEEAYAYCVSSWCVSSSSNALINYQGLGPFGANSRCGAPYFGYNGFRAETAEMLRVCSNNWECRHDSMSTGLPSEGRETLRLIGEVEESTVPPRGLIVEPRGVRLREATSVKLSVKIPSSPNGLEGFGIWKLHWWTLTRLYGPLIILRDSGEITEGDEMAGDNVYTNFFTHRGNNDDYQAVPLINGSFRFNRQDLIFTLPLANRAYSEVSNVAVANPHERLRFVLRSVSDVYLEIKYQWGQRNLGTGTVPRLQTATKFVGGIAGRGCSGPAPFIDFSGDYDGVGFVETAKVEIGRAFNVRRWINRTVIALFVEYDRFSGSFGHPMTITVVARRRSNDEAIANAFALMATYPGSSGEDCAAETTSLSGQAPTARLTINREGEEFVCTLAPNT